MPSQEILDDYERYFAYLKANNLEDSDEAWQYWLSTPGIHYSPGGFVFIPSMKPNGIAGLAGYVFMPSDNKDSGDDQ